MGVSDDPFRDPAGLLQVFARVPDPRDPRGRVHTLASLLAVTVSALAAGQRSVSAIGEWVADLPSAVLAGLEVTRDRFTGGFLVPDAFTIGRTLARLDADALDAALTEWVLNRTDVDSVAGWRAVAVDGKTVRGSGRPGSQTHLLAALDQRCGTVLAQRIWRTKVASRRCRPAARSSRRASVPGRYPAPQPTAWRRRRGSPPYV
ncbi:transposase family protein [Actinoplanes campanulatus]